MKIFKTILQVNKAVVQIAATIIAVGVIAGAAVWFDSFGDKQDEILVNQDYASAERTLLSGEIQSIDDSLKEIKAHQLVQDQHMRDMAVAAEFYIKNQRVMTEKSMEEALSAILKKNITLSSTVETVLPE